MYKKIKLLLLIIFSGFLLLTQTGCITLNYLLSSKSTCVAHTEEFDIIKEMVIDNSKSQYVLLGEQFNYEFPFGTDGGRFNTFSSNILKKELNIYNTYRNEIMLFDYTFDKDINKLRPLLEYDINRKKGNIISQYKIDKLSLSQQKVNVDFKINFYSSEEERLKYSLVVLASPALFLIDLALMPISKIFDSKDESTYLSLIHYFNPKQNHDFCF